LEYSKKYFGEAHGEEHPSMSHGLLKAKHIR